MQVEGGPGGTAYNTSRQLHGALNVVGSGAGRGSSGEATERLRALSSLDTSSAVQGNLPRPATNTNNNLLSNGMCSGAAA